MKNSSDKCVSKLLNISCVFYPLDCHRHGESFEYSTSFVLYHLSSTCNESALSKNLSVPRDLSLLFDLHFEIGSYLLYTVSQRFLMADIRINSTSWKFINDLGESTIYTHSFSFIDSLRYLRKYR